MKIELKQNSWAWWQHRKNFLNASEIGTIMGLNPYETPEELMKKKLFGSNFVTNEAVEHGKKMEPQANLFFSVKTKRNYEPAVFTKELFSASLDGYHEASQTMLEIKCPLKKNSSSWKDFFEKNVIPPYYWAQIQCGLFCSDTQKAYFLVYFNPQENFLQEVVINPSFIGEMMIKGRAYQKLFNDYQNQMKGEKP
ncbi:lambda-exonuclease family protein [Candidatus Phytoplasma phoenicium]|uniref:YqaJ-like viral recombinase domain n=1 Tax=Candidatus Phytoplasma phoenicium TaxID=198422 RepID=A0A0L0MKC9_9MOLU|nr:YqaJ viral recombinase family protein [Candidatus Phytoplasma phoenicium]KND62731.1 YqaJ-like viral recombinase domain [Candidatus Phytoplasma phoenicium]